MEPLYTFLLLLAGTGLAAADTCAVCDLAPNPNLQAGSPAVHGEVLLYQGSPSAPVYYTLNVEGFAQGGLHGFHVHALGDLTDGCESTGSHFNPQGVNHGGPLDTVRHVGDLGNVLVSPSGTIVDYTSSDSVISLDAASENDIMGRAIVIHADPDDLGRGGFPDSLTTGHAGARLACCVIKPTPCD